MTSRIIALNLPARAREEIAGNPVTSRPESVVANCFPGLEIDHRNLDRRFFPGLVIEFVSQSLADQDNDGLGAKILAVDSDDPDIPDDPSFKKSLTTIQKYLSEGRKLFLLSLKQDGSEIPLSEKGPAGPLDGLVVWRLVRSLEPGTVAITVAERGSSKKKRGAKLSLQAPRRTYQSAIQTIPAAYAPGEMTQSLCSPWQHDFRDCSCNYWASNHPDIMLANDLEASPESPTSGAEPATRTLIWLRSEQSDPIAARETAQECRPFEMDHYEINQRWQELPVVIEGRKLLGVYAPDLVTNASPFGSEGELINKLHELAAIEHALALEYLYARYSVVADDSLTAEQRQHAEYVSHELLMIATSEMTHLRWANQLLRELWQDEETAFRPELRVATHVPGKNGLRSVAMRSIAAAIDSFIDAEEPSATLEGQYAKVFATLRNGYPPSMAELASRIIGDGVSHFVRFNEIKVILRAHAKPARNGADLPQALCVPFVRELEPAANDNRFATIKRLYSEIIAGLTLAYQTGHAEDRTEVIKAQNIMMKLDKAAVVFSRENKKEGIPFAEIGYDVATPFCNDPAQTHSR